jgi:transposase
MRKNDARKLDHKTLEELRMRVVKRVQDGASPEVLAKALDLHRSTVYGWLARYRQGGWNGLKAKPIAGRPPKLGGKKMQWVSDTVTQEPVAIEIRVRAVDARDGSCADQGQVRDKAERRVGGATSRATLDRVSEAASSRAGARRSAGSAMAEDGISAHQGDGARSWR